MRNILLFLLLVLFERVCLTELPEESIQIDNNTVFVLFGTRHGNRHPEVFLAENPRSWGFEGSTELTSFGKRQGYGLGKELRKFIGKLVSNNYNMSQVRYYSSSANRCQMTLQTTVAGIHPPENWADWNTELFDHWSPIPYTINDAMLRLYSVDECTKSDEVWKPIIEDSLANLQKKKKDHQDLLEYIGKHTGWNMTSLGRAADLADNLIEIDLFGSTYPDWIKHPRLVGYDFEKMRAEIMSFAEIHQIACADYEPCGGLMAGRWLQDILDKLQKASEGRGPSLVGYASHTEITLSVMKLMGIEKEELTTSAGFIIELRKTPAPAIRLLNHDPNPIDKHVIYQAKLSNKFDTKIQSDGFILLEDFVKIVGSKAYSKWRTACGIA